MATILIERRKYLTKDGEEACAYQIKDGNGITAKIVEGTSDNGPYKFASINVTKSMVKALMAAGLFEAYKPDTSTDDELDAAFDDD